MRSPLIVVVDIVRDGHESLVLADKAVMPDALFLERAEKPLDHAVLLQRVWRYVFLHQPILLNDPHELCGTKDQPVIAAYGQRPRWPP